MLAGKRKTNSTMDDDNYELQNLKSDEVLNIVYPFGASLEVMPSARGCTPLVTSGTYTCGCVYMYVCMSMSVRGNMGLGCYVLMILSITMCVYGSYVCM